MLAISISLIWLSLWSIVQFAHLSFWYPCIRIKYEWEINPEKLIFSFTPIPLNLCVLYVCAKSACESFFVLNNAYHSCAHSHIKYTYTFSMCIKTLIYVFLCARISYGILKRRVMKSVPFKKFWSAALHLRSSVLWILLFRGFELFWSYQMSVIRL